MSQEHDDRITYLQMVENVINRMSSICATFKGFAITVFVGVPAIALSKDGPNCAWILALSCVALVTIAGFDCWYLSMEKRYRKLYSKIVDGSHPVDFDMRINKYVRDSWCEAVSSKSIWLFYLVFVCADLILILACAHNWL
jgi:hypothetical protein